LRFSPADLQCVGAVATDFQTGIAGGLTPPLFFSDAPQEVYFN